MSTLPIGGHWGGSDTIEGVARDHAARMAYCRCSICGVFRLMEKKRIECEQKSAEAALTERLMKEWP